MQTRIIIPDLQWNGDNSIHFVAKICCFFRNMLKWIYLQTENKMPHTCKRVYKAISIDKICLFTKCTFKFECIQCALSQFLYK